MTTRVGAAEATAEELHILGLLHIDQVGTARVALHTLRHC